MSDLIYCELAKNQEKVPIDYQDGFTYHTLLTCVEGIAVLGMFTWSDEKTLAKIECISLQGLHHISKAQFKNDNGVDYLELTFGDKNTKPNLSLPLTKELIKDQEYQVRFTNMIMADGSTNGGHGSILTRPNPLVSHKK